MSLLAGLGLRLVWFGLRLAASTFLFGRSLRMRRLFGHLGLGGRNRRWMVVPDLRTTRFVTALGLAAVMTHLGALLATFFSPSLELSSLLGPLAVLSLEFGAVNLMVRGALTQVAQPLSLRKVAAFILLGPFGHRLAKELHPAQLKLIEGTQLSAWTRRQRGARFESRDK